MEQPTATELAAVLNVKIWKFHPPMPSGSRFAAFTLQFARRGDTTKRIAQLRGLADTNLPLTIALRTPGDITSDSSRRAEVYLAQGDQAMKTVMDNYFAGHSVASTRLQPDESGRIVLLAGSEDNTKGPHGGSMDNDLVLFLTVEELK